jgi:hypothetical protein
MSEDRTRVLEEPRDEDEEFDDEEYASGPGRAIAIGAVVAMVLGVAGYFVGHASAKSGPATLAQAVQQAQDGKLACGDTGAAATPAAGGGGDAAGAPPGAGGGQFFLRAICNSGANGAGTAGAGGAGARGGFAGRGFGAGGGFGVVGQVQSVSGNTLSIQGRQGTIRVKLSPSTTVRKSATGSLSDIKPGAAVSVAGTGQNNTNPATTITILPTQQ